MKFINNFIDLLKTGKVKAGIKAEKYLDRAANDLGKTKAALKLAQIYEKRGKQKKPSRSIYWRQCPFPATGIIPRRWPFTSTS